MFLNNFIKIFYYSNICWLITDGNRMTSELRAGTVLKLSWDCTTAPSTQAWRRRAKIKAVANG